MIDEQSMKRQRERDRERLRFELVRKWRSAGKFDFSDAELEAEIDRRYADILGRRQLTPQLQLPLLDVGQVAARAKREACRSTRNLRLGLRARVTELLDQAGSDGLTREQLASGLGVKEGSVSAPVRYLLDSDLACEPTTRTSTCGNTVSVVVLSCYAKGTYDA